MLRNSSKLIAVLAAVAIPAAAFCEWQPDDSDRRQRTAGEAVERLQARLPGTRRYFEDAYGYAVWPTIGRVGLGFGGAYGKGLVVEQHEAIGTSSYWQFSSGIQAGAKTFSLIIFFRDKAALDRFKQGSVQFMGQAGLDLATVGVNGTPGYSEGVAVFALTRLGLMGELSASGVKFGFKPLQE